MNLGAPSWLVELLRSVSVWDLVLILAALIALVVFIRRKGWRWIVAFARGVVNSAEILAAVQDLPAFIERTDQRHAELAEKVDGIHHETHKNDGSSIKDAVGRVEHGVAGLHERMDTVEADVKALRESDDQLRAADDQLRADLESTQPPKKEPS